MKGTEGEREVSVLEGRQKYKIQFVYSMKVCGFAECMRHGGGWSGVSHGRFPRG